MVGTKLISRNLELMENECETFGAEKEFKEN
jgi:hypothetical protein